MRNIYKISYIISAGKENVQILKFWNFIEPEIVAKHFGKKWYFIFESKVKLFCLSKEMYQQFSVLISILHIPSATDSHKFTR